MAQHLFEGLYRFDDDSATVPALAKDVKISDDGRKYHFTLREGLSGAMASQSRPKILFILGKTGDTSDYWTECLFTRQC